jgi:hypothetical protein
MLEVTALAERQEVVAVVVDWAVVEMRAGEDHARPWQLHWPGGQGRELLQLAASAVKPSSNLT